MSSNKYDTDQWELGAFIQWKPKYRQQECSNCKGEGRIGGGFKDIDGARNCNVCHGSGQVSIPPDTKEPDIPSDLKEHLRRAWWDFHNKPDARPDE